MPKFSDSNAAHVNTNLESYPLVSATDLCTNGNVIQLFAKRTAKTQFGESVFVDFMYADDPYTPEGYREFHYTTLFSIGSPAAKQLEAMEDLNYNDPLECKIVAAGRTFKLADPDAPTEAPTSPQAAPTAKPAQAPSRPAANAATRSPAPTTAHAPARPQARPQARPAPMEPDELPF